MGKTDMERTGRFMKEMQEADMIYKEKYEAMKWEKERFRKKYNILIQWMRLKQNNVEFIEFFRERNIKSLALYGVGDMGRLICDELYDHKIIKYGIDRQRQQEGKWFFPVYVLEEVKQKADAILITPVLITDEIEHNIFAILGQQTTYVLEEVLFELSRKHHIKCELWPE